jgi:ferritin-like metal-binding protein YciE
MAEIGMFRGTFPTRSLIPAGVSLRPRSLSESAREIHQAFPEPSMWVGVGRPGGAHRAGAPAQITNTERTGKMGFFSKDIKTLDDLFVHTLRDIYYAEKQIETALPKMIKKASSAELKAGFEKHLEETHGHIARLEEVFELHGEKAKAVNCPAIDGIIEETDEISGDIDDPEVLDAALIAAAQAVEHYEITRYGTLIAWAKQMGRSDCAAVLKKNLDEEKATDKKLTGLAESRINLQAAE